MLSPGNAIQKSRCQDLFANFDEIVRELLFLSVPVQDLNQRIQQIFRKEGCKMIQVSDVSKSFHGFQALDQVQMHVPKDLFTVLSGQTAPVRQL